MTKLQPTVLVTINGGIADVTTTEGIRVVLIDYDVLESGDLTDQQFHEISDQVDQLKAMKNLPMDMKEEIQEAAEALERYAEANTDHN